MDQLLAVIKSVTGPFQSAYYKAFNANKYAAGIGLSVVITTFLLTIAV